MVSGSRAAYGHSVDVELESGDSPVPRNLYHGTAPENVTDILPRTAYGRCHGSTSTLTDSVDEARNVGERHAVDAVVLRIDAA